MRFSHRSIPVVFAWAALAAVSAQGLIMVGEGNDPMEDPGFPDGAMEVINRESRTGFREGPPFGGGEYLFLFRETDTAGFNAALEDFAAVRVPQPAYRSLISLTGETTTWHGETPLLLVVRDGPPAVAPPGEGRVDWTFHLWVPGNFHALYSGDAGWLADHPNQRQPVPPPRVDVYLGEASPIRWEDVRVPEGIRVEDRRAAVAPARGAVHGRVMGMPSHAGLPGAVVRLTPGGDPVAGFEATAGPGGDYRFEDMPAGRYTLQCEAPGHASRVIGTFEFGRGTDLHGTDALLAPTGSTAGVVVDADGDPLARVTVEARDVVGLDGRGYACPATAKAETGPGGRFVLSGLPEGSARLRVRAAGLHQVGGVHARFPVRARWHGDAGDARLVMTGTGEVKVTLALPAGGDPARQYLAELEPEGGNRVGSWGGSAQIEPGGDFTFAGIPPGVYLLTVKPNPGPESERTAPVTLRIRAGSSTNVSVTAR